MEEIEIKSRVNQKITLLLFFKCCSQICSEIFKIWHFSFELSLSLEWLMKYETFIQTSFLG